MGANKPVAPASLLQVGGAGRVVGKKSLELWERLWEPKIATLVNVHEHGRTLPLVAVGDNRIGKVIFALWILPAASLVWAHDGIHDQWYESLTVPGTTTGCCGYDCKPTQTTIGGRAIPMGNG